MKKFRRIILFTIIFIMFFIGRSLAHGGNVTGWKDKNSSSITFYNGNYYGYHNKDGVRHYHQVQWDTSKQKWEILKTAVCYDENFNIINTSSSNEKIKVLYKSSVDGDTTKFELNGEIITVRFLGIDTPETVHPTLGEEPFGKDASNFTSEKLKSANKIELEYDESASKTDKYGRHLAWVFVDDVLLQEELIKNGLAKTYMLQDNYTYTWCLQEKEEVARKNGLGIWSNMQDEYNNTVRK